MKRWIAIIVVAAQLGVLGFMAGEREWVLRTGRTVYLRTAPVDPRDPMRGDYVRLNYEIAEVPKRLCRDGVVQWFAASERGGRQEFRDRSVYASIRLDDEGVAELLALSERKPDSGLFVRGRVNTVSRSSIDVRFGVEAFFMQQGKAREFENLAFGPKAGVPLNMEVAVGPGGLAVAKGYKWEPLGIVVTLDRLPQTTNRTGPVERRELRGVTVELKNHGSAPLVVFDRPKGASFHLLSREDRWSGSASLWTWVGEDRAATPPVAGDVKLLQPGESLRTHLDFTAPEWFVQKSEKGEAGPPVSLETLSDQWGAWFRIEYVPPSHEACAGLPHAERVRHSKLTSRGFTPAGGAD